MIETVKKTPSPNYTPREISDALERAMMKARYPMWYAMERLKAIDNYLNIQENEYDSQTIPPRLTTERNAEAANG